MHFLWKRSIYISMLLYIFKRFGTWKDLKGNTMLKRISLENFAMWFQDQDLFWKVNYNNERIINDNNTRQTDLHHYYGLILLSSAHLKRTTVVYLLFHSSLLRFCNKLDLTWFQKANMVLETRTTFTISWITCGSIGSMLAKWNSIC